MEKNSFIFLFSPEFQEINSDFSCFCPCKEKKNEKYRKFFLLQNLRRRRKKEFFPHMHTHMESRFSTYNRNLLD